MENIYETILEDYFKLYEIDHRDDLSKLSNLKGSIVSLRNSYRSNLCDTDYESKEHRDAYMLAYYPFYIGPIQFVLSKIKEEPIFSNNKLVASIYASGPSPEMLGAVKYLKEHLNINRFDINLFDYEQGWREQREFTKQYINKYINTENKINEFYGCDLLIKCSECFDKYNKCKRKVFKKTDIYIMQNCLNHITNNEDFLEKIKEIMFFSKPNSILIMIDLNYKISKSIMRDVNKKLSDIAEIVISNVDSKEVKIKNHLEVPDVLSKYIFTGEDGLIPKKNTNFYYNVLKKK